MAAEATIRKMRYFLKLCKNQRSSFHTDFFDGDPLEDQIEPYEIVKYMKKQTLTSKPSWQSGSH